MRIRELAVPGAYEIIPSRFTDDRGSFFELLRPDLLAEATGDTFAVAQVNHSVSRRDVIRGIHGTRVPPGQAKYVTCVRGALLDIVVDIRAGSPTFGEHVRTELDADSGRAVYVGDGLGHGFRALTEGATICYLVGAAFVPGTQLDIDPLDPELDLPWGLSGPPLISAKDAGAPTLAQHLAAGTLPRWQPSLEVL
ncbi:dTDP-4-dehydrorhamnose 3,5-epimerase family protein [Actinokineospora sp. G85]|uniref:dTDP-4-dehydrorhamnose 3,5-epimerase family protein n=1 Tax=Actinokineospora sp. G85 TaxID=3406626 RepID=UPI003C78D3CE